LPGEIPALEARRIEAPPFTAARRPLASAIAPFAAVGRGPDGRGGIVGP
jgi:hypothetical protein